jgi:hypothetical protein
MIHLRPIPYLTRIRIRSEVRDFSDPDTKHWFHLSISEAGTVPVPTVQLAKKCDILWVTWRDGYDEEEGGARVRLDRGHSGAERMEMTTAQHHNPQEVPAHSAPQPTAC